MQLISLNTWGGRVSGINRFVENKKRNTDIFCFQEVYSNASETLRETPEEHLHFFEELKVILSDFDGYFAPQVDGVGLASFVRRNIAVEHANSAVILSDDDLRHFKMPDGKSYRPRVLQLLVLKEPKLTIYNFHGVPGVDKNDSPEREFQTKRLFEILRQDSSHKILIGDFNINPNTVAVSAIERIMQNPLKQSGFNSTRSSLYKKRNAMPFADYIFVSPEIKIQSFQVLQDEVSDHLPLCVTF